jgi:hypothetical protein
MEEPDAGSPALSELVQGERVRAAGSDARSSGKSAVRSVGSVLVPISTALLMPARTTVAMADPRAWSLVLQSPFSQARGRAFERLARFGDRRLQTCRSGPFTSPLAPCSVDAATSVSLARMESIRGERTVNEQREC